MEKGIQRRERFIQMKRIKECFRKRKNLNWALKDGQNQYTEIKEGPHPHPTGQRREIFWVRGILQPKAQKSKIQRMLREQQMADCEQNLYQRYTDQAYTWPSKNTERAGAGQGEL